MLRTSNQRRAAELGAIGAFACGVSPVLLLASTLLIGGLHTAAAARTQLSGDSGRVGSGRALLGTASVAVDNGQLKEDWTSWSWGWQVPYMKQDDTNAMCMQLDPFGALSLKANARSFEMDKSTIQIRLDSLSGNDTLHNLQLQLEQGADQSKYYVSNGVPLATLTQGSDTSRFPLWVTVPAARFKGSTAGSDHFDRISIGRCLQTQKQANETLPCNDSQKPITMCIGQLQLQSS